MAKGSSLHLEHQNGHDASGLTANGYRTTSTEAAVDEEATLLRPGSSKAKRGWLLPVLQAGTLVALLAAVGVLATTIALLPRQLSSVLQSQSHEGKLAAADSGPVLVDNSIELCSGNGILYDSETTGCLCYECYTGPTCAVQTPLDECVINADAGNPYIYEQWWADHPQASLIMKPSEHLGYRTALGNLPRLLAAIENVHALAGNVVTQGREIIVFTGSSEAITIAIKAMSVMMNGTAASVNATACRPKVWAQGPYYSGYLENAAAWAPGIEWASDDPVPPEEHASVIELVTAPGNPDGRMQVSQLPGAWVIHDHAYRWPMFCPSPAPVSYGEKEIAVFTLSKLTGHAGSRVGWAVVQDPALAAGMRRLASAFGGVSAESQARTANLLEAVLATRGDGMDFGRREMQRRWAELQRIEASSGRFKFQALETPVMDTWTGQVQPYSPPYLWIDCLDTQRDANCYDTLLAAGLRGRAGDKFGATDNYARLELLMRPAEFDMMAAKLARLALS